MWMMYSFLLVLFCAALSEAHPKTAHEKLGSDLHFIAVNKTGRGEAKNQTGASGLESIQINASGARRLQENAAVQNAQRPRFLVTYGNMYKPNPPFLSPVDPFQNILLYFLMNFGRELSQSSFDESKLRRPAEFFNNARTPNKDSSHERYPPSEMMENEDHIFPHVDGTCMCFNRRQSRNQELTAKAAEEFKKQSYCKRFNTETTELKTENHNVPSSNDSGKSTVAVQNPNNTIIKVLKLVGHNKTSNLEATTKLTTPKNAKEEIVITGEEIVVDLQLIPDDNNGADKHERKKAKEESDPINKIADAIQHNATNTNKTRRDESYYFLSSSGGTDQRTTASNKLTFHVADTNAMHAEEKTLALRKRRRDSKRRKKRVRRHLEKIEEYLHENLKLRKNERETNISAIKDLQNNWREVLHVTKKEDNNHLNKSKEQKEVKPADNKNVMVMLPMARMEEELDNMSDINGITNLKSVEEIIKYHNWAPIEEELELQEPSRLSNMIPTLLGIGTVLLIIGYIMKTKGWCYNLVSNGPNPVAAETRIANEMKT